MIPPLFAFVRKASVLLFLEIHSLAFALIHLFLSGMTNKTKDTSALTVQAFFRSSSTKSLFFI